MPTSCSLSDPDRKLHAGVILLNSTTELLDVAPFHLMGSLASYWEELPDDVQQNECKQQALDIEPHWINETGQPAQLTTGMRVLPTNTFEDCPPLDIVLIGASKMDYMPTEEELAFIRKSHDTCQAFIAVCGGYQPLLLAGLLEGKSAAVPRILLDEVRRTHPNTDWLDKRWHCHEKIWTTGTLVNGLDAMRAFALHTWGSRGDMIKNILDRGSWPVRDVDYKEDLQRIESIFQKSG